MMIEPSKVGDWNYISTLGAGSFGVVTLWKNVTNDEFIGR